MDDADDHDGGKDGGWHRLDAFAVASAPGNERQAMQRVAEAVATLGLPPPSIAVEYGRRGAGGGTQQRYVICSSDQRYLTEATPHLVDDLAQDLLVVRRERRIENNPTCENVFEALIVAFIGDRRIGIVGQAREVAWPSVGGDRRGRFHAPVAPSAASPGG